MIQRLSVPLWLMSVLSPHGEAGLGAYKSQDFLPGHHFRLTAIAANGINCTLSTLASKWAVTKLLKMLHLVKLSLDNWFQVKISPQKQRVQSPFYPADVTYAKHCTIVAITNRMRSLRNSPLSLRWWTNSHVTRNSDAQSNFAMTEHRSFVTQHHSFQSRVARP